MTVGPVERAVAELRNADFDRWLDELVRDAFGNAPAPGEPGRPLEGDGWDIGGWHDPGEWLDARATARLGRFARARDRHRRFSGCRRRIPRAGEPGHLRP